MSNYTELAGPNNSSHDPTPAVNKVVKKAGTVAGNKKGNSAERRATHNAVERARRESLNVRFLQLAANLPATCTVRRPSKSLIVNKSLEFVEQALFSEAILRSKIEELINDNRNLREEVNTHRQEKGQVLNLIEVDLSCLPKPLSAINFKTNSQKALASLQRGSFSLGGEFDDEYNSGQASTSSVSSTGSPPSGARSQSHSGLPIHFSTSPRLGDSLDSGSNLSTGPFFADAFSFPQPSSSVDTNRSFTSQSPTYIHNLSSNDRLAQMQLQQQPPVSQSGFSSMQQFSTPQVTGITSASTPALNAFSNQFMGVFTLPEESLSPESSQMSKSLSTKSASAIQPGTSTENIATSSSPDFASLVSNLFFDHRYSTSASTSTPTTRGQ